MIHPGVGTWVPSSHSWPWARLPSAPPLMPFFSYLPVKASGAGRGLGMARDIIWVRKRMAGPDAHSPEPSQALVLYLPPGLSMGATRWMGSFVLRQWGWICLWEQVSRRASVQQNRAWMRAEHYLSQVNVLNAPCPRWEETDLIFRVSRGRGSLNVHTLLLTATVLTDYALDYRRKECVNRPEWGKRSDDWC